MEIIDPVVCISHNDLDGMCAGYCVKRKYPQARMFWTNYGRDIPNNAFVQGAKLFVTDFSLTMFEFEKARRNGMQIVWIDHHKANYTKLQSEGMNCEGLRRDDKCGAYLTFEYLFPGKEIPEVLKLVNDYDLWKFQDPRTEGFVEGMKLMETRPNFKSCYIWDSLFSEDKESADKHLGNIIKMGTKIHKYIAQKNALMCEELAYKTVFNGANVLVANTKQTNSTFFDSADKSGVDALCIIQFAPDIGKYRGSFYSPDNVKETLHLAVSLGGGGHPKEAGFQSVVYPFDRPVIKDDSRPNPGYWIDKYRELKHSRKNPAINQAAVKSDKIALVSSGFRTSCVIPGKICFAINHPYLTELLSSFFHTVDVINSDTGEVLDMVVSFVLTKNGFYRNSACFVNPDDNLTVEQFTEHVKGDLMSNVIIEQSGYGLVYHWYSRDIPVLLPTKITV